MTTPSPGPVLRRLETLGGGIVSAAPRHVWYAAYGSNMHAARLAYYLNGGTPPGGARTYPGCRDPREPGHAYPVMLPGRLYFAFESRAWTGGMAFYDPDAPGETAARAYLLDVSQFCDIAAQEMYRETGTDLDLGRVLADGRARLGPGRYETLVCPGLLDGRPVLTFTAPWGIDEAEWNVPAPRYLRYLASGLAEGHGWDKPRIARYLAECPGLLGRMSAGDVATVIGDGGGDRAGERRH